MPGAAKQSVLGRRSTLAYQDEFTIGVEKLLDPTAYTGLCSQMARAAAYRGRAAAQELQR